MQCKAAEMANMQLQQCSFTDVALHTAATHVCCIVSIFCVLTRYDLSAKMSHLDHDIDCSILLER